VEVLGLHPHAARKDVEAKLGKPGSFEEVFRASSIPELILRYGPWELAFIKERLFQRNKQ
jgi:hypothetical protein